MEISYFSGVTLYSPTTPRSRRIAPNITKQSAIRCKFYELVFFNNVIVFPAIESLVVQTLDGSSARGDVEEFLPHQALGAQSY